MAGWSAAADCRRVAIPTTLLGTHLPRWAQSGERPLTEPTAAAQIWERERVKVFTNIEVSKRSMDYGRTFHSHHRMTADTVIATPQLVALLKERIGRDADLAGKIAARAAQTGLRN